MNATAAKTSYTPADLLAMPDEKNYELVDGQLVERNMSVLSSWVAGRLFFHLQSFCEADPLGWVWPEGTGYQCWPNAPLRVRKADVSFIRTERLPTDASTEGYLSIRPDLAVEVVSPNDTVWEVDEKVAEYLEVGVPLVWVVRPRSRSVLVHRSNRSVTWLGDEDEFSGEDILPGFRCRVGAIFPPWAGAGAGGAAPEPR
jgi:Uma2 family endonuclease